MRTKGVTFLKLLVDLLNGMIHAHLGSDIMVI